MTPRSAGQQSAPTPWGATSVTAARVTHSRTAPVKVNSKSVLKMVFPQLKCPCSKGKLT